MLSDKELEILRRKMADLEEDPPIQAWEKIKTDIQPKTYYRRAWWFAAASVLIGLFCIIGLNHYRATLPTVVKGTLNQDKHSMGKLASGDSAHKRSHNIAYEKIPASPDHNSGVPAVKKAPVKAIIITNSNQQYISKPGPTMLKDRSYAARAGKFTAQDAMPNMNSYKLGANGSTETEMPGINTRPQNDAWKDVITDKSRQSAGMDSLVAKMKPDSSKTERVTAAPETNTYGTQRAWSLGVLLSPRYSFRIFAPVTADSIYIKRLNTQNKAFSERVGYELGISFSKPLNKHLSLDVGLSWLKLKENTSYAFTTGAIDSLHFVQTSENQFKVNPIYHLEERQLINSFIYAGGHIGLSYYFRQGQNSSFNVSIAGGGNFLLNGKSKQYMNGEWYQTLSYPSKDNFFEQSIYQLLIGFGYNRNLGKSYELRLMPSLNYILGPALSNQEPYGIKPYSFSVNIQVSRQFIKE